MKQKIVIVGCGTHFHSVYDSLDEESYTIVGCFDNLIKEQTTPEGIKVLGGLDDLDKLNKEEIDGVIICIGDIALRRKLLNEIHRLGLKQVTIIDPTSIVSKQARIGEGTFVGKRAVINANCTIGEACIINTGSIIEHDCVIKENVHVSVGAILCGVVEVENDVMIGAGSTIIQHIHIEENSTIGANATIIRNVEKGTTVVGSPGRKVK